MLARPRCGRLCVEYTLMHQRAAKAQPAGAGRDEPNANPTLPEPPRVSMVSLLNPLNILAGPFRILIDLLGPNVLRQLCCLGVCAAFVFMLILMVPQVMGDLFMSSVDGMTG